MIFYPINLKGGENTKSKRLFIILAILIILSIGAVNAADNATDGALNATDQESLGDFPDPGSFTELNDYIAQEVSQGHTTISLNKSYEFVAGDDADGISISAQGLTIEGNGKTIDAKNLARIFTLSGSGITLNNINFTHASKHAVVVEENAANCVINNSYFYHNSLANGHSNPGGAILWNGENGKVTNSVFHNNSVQFTNDTYWDRGGSIFWYGDNGYLAYCDFSDDFAYEVGGSVSWGNEVRNPKNGMIYRCNFTNSKVLYHGGALSVAGESCSVIECNFTGNTAVHAGAVIVEDGAIKTNITRCIFKDNHVEYNDTIDVLANKTLVGLYSSAGALEIDASRVTVDRCEFLANFAYDDGDHKEFAGFFAGAAKVAGNAEFVRILNSNFTDNYAQYCGAIEWNGYKGLVDNCNFTLNHADDNGAIGWNGNDGLVDNSNFTENYAENNAGAVFWDGENGKVLSSNFAQNRADNEGGAIFWNGESGNVSYSNFTENDASYGGAISWKGNNGDLSNSIFIKNTADEEGGAIFYWYDYNRYTEDPVKNAAMSNCNFTDNSALYGGAISWNGDNGTFSNSNFINNTAENGGAIGSWGSDLSITGNCNFTSNNATDCGGAIFIGEDGYDNHVSDNYFLKNNAPTGGAVYWNAVSGSLTDSYFIGNDATEEGGAVYWNANLGTLSVSDFKDNSAKKGGAVYWQGESGSLTDSNFTGNNATEEGGALFVNYYGKSIEDSNFTSNSAIDGGAIYMAYHTPISGSTFTGNNATSKGGAIFVADDDSEITNSNFTSNTATDGGAIYSGCYWEDWDDIYGSTTITFANFINNTAKQNGGAIYYLAEGQTLENANFTGNTAVLGGAIFAEANQVNIDVAYFNNNNATKGSAIYKTEDSDEMKISNTLFERNQAHSKEITIDIEGNRTYALADVTVKISLVANDNIANAIWNDGGLSTIQLKNIQCEFSLDSQGRELKQFNVGDYYAPTGDSYGGDYKLWQNPLEDAQLIDIIIRNQTDVIYNITAGVLEKNSDEGILRALPDDSGLTVTKTDGSITIEFKGLKAGKYSVDAVHKEDAYYKEVANSDSFVIYNLTVNKTTDDVLVAVGQNVTYNITIFNNGDQNISNIAVVDLLPDYFKLLSYSTTWLVSSETQQANPDFYADFVQNSDNQFIIGNKVQDEFISMLGPHEGIVLTLVYNATKEGKYKNVIAVYSDSPDIIEVNSDNDTVVVPVTLNVTKKANETVVANNSLVDYTILVNNTSLVNITVFNMTLTGNPISYSINSQSTIKINGTKSFIIYGIDATCTVEDNYAIFKAGSGYSLSYMVQNADGTNITYFADGDEIKYIFNNVILNPENIVTKYETYTVKATNVTVVDTLPVGLEYYSSEGVYYSASRTVVWTIDDLSGSTKLWIVARATALGTLNNTVSVNCNENKTNVTANRTVNVLFANFTVNKTVDLRSIDVNKTVNYTIFINNTGEVNLTNIKVHDKFTDRFVLVDYSDKDKWSYNNDGVFTYNGNITVKGNATLVLVVQLTQTGVYNNTVNVTSGEVENKTSTSENTTVYNPSLNVTKVVETSPIIIGDKAVFTINVTNTGDRAIKDVRVFEQYNAALIYDTFLNVKGEWKIIKTSDMSYFYIESLDINESSSFKIYFNTTISGTFENNVTAQFEDNENVKNASDEVTVEPIPTHTIVGNVTGYPGENVTIPVNVTADDGKPFTGQVNVTFPDGTSKIVDITNGTGNTTWKIPESYIPGDYPDHANYTGNETYLPSNGTGNVKVLPIPTNTTVGNVTGYPGQEVTIPVNVTADDGKPFTGKVNVTFPDGTSKIVDITNGTGNTTWKIPESYIPGDYPDRANYTGNETYLPSNGTGNVKVLPIPTNTTVGNVTGYPGQEVTIPVNVTADDGKPFNGKVNVTLPDGDIKEVTITNGTGNVTWTIPSDLPTGNYTVPGNYSGNVTYLPSNGTGNVEVIPIPTITTIGNVTGYAGHNVTIPVNVTADDGIPFTGQVNVTFPDGTSKIVDIVNGTGSTVWKIPETYEPGDYPDKANFTGRYPYLPSHGPGYVRVIPIPTNTEIGNVTGTPGQNVTIPVNVTTDDGEPFNGTVNVTLPDGTTHEVNITNGTGNITWHIPDDFKPGDYPDSADYGGNNTYLPSKGSGVVKVVIIDVELKITVDRPNVDYGDYVEFIVTVHNKGPSDATGTIAKISIPEGFVYVSDNCTDKNYQSKRALLKASASSQSYDAKKGLWYIGDLANDETVKLAIIAQANFLGTKAVPASVSIEEPETDYTNNNGSVSVSVKPVADVQIVKTVDKTKIKPGDKVTYTFTVTNNGPNDATGVKVVDSQLTKFKFVKASSKDYNKNTGEWTIGKLANGSSVTLTVTVIIDKVGNYPNTATVSSNEKDSNMSNNKASSKVVSVVKVGGPHDKIKDHGSDKKTADKDAKSDSTVSKMHETGNPIFMALIVVLGLILLPLRRRK